MCGLTLPGEKYFHLNIIISLYFQPVSLLTWLETFHSVLKISQYISDSLSLSLPHCLELRKLGEIKTREMSDTLFLLDMLRWVSRDNNVAIINYYLLMTSVAKTQWQVCIFLTRKIFSMIFLQSYFSSVCSFYVSFLNICIYELWTKTLPLNGNKHSQTTTGYFSRLEENVQISL